MALQTSLIPVKIQCGCGQRYAFDVEPLAGRMPGAVACPVCGIDGTEAANNILAERFQATPPSPPQPQATRISIPSAPPAPGPTRVSAPTTSPQRVSVVAAAPAQIAQVAPAASPARVTVANSVAAPTANAPTEVAPTRQRLPGQLDPDQAQKEARAKIMWGDDPAEVAKFLMSHGFKNDEAKACIAPIVLERAASVRKTGMSKIFTGIGMMLLPVVAWFVFMAVGYLPVKIFGATVVFGLWGLTRVLNGIIMYLSPKSEKGDVSDM